MRVLKVEKDPLISQESSIIMTLGETKWLKEVLKSWKSVEMFLLKDSTVEEVVKRLEQEEEEDLEEEIDLLEIRLLHLLKDKNEWYETQVHSRLLFLS